MLSFVFLKKIYSPYLYSNTTIIGKDIIRMWPASKIGRVKEMPELNEKF